jgi:hypothetical protein
MDITAKLKERKDARMARVKAVKDMSAVQRVRVVPTKDEYRKVLRHPVNNQAFRETGSMEWPFDAFTKRRLRDGSLSLEEGADLREKAKPLGEVENLNQTQGTNQEIQDTSSPAKSSKSREPVVSQEPSQNRSGQEPAKTF